MTRMMRDREWALRLGQRVAEPGVGRFNQDRTHIDAAIRHHASVTAHELALVEIRQHVGADALFVMITALAINLGPDAKRRQNLDARARVADFAQHLDETIEKLGVLLFIPGARHRAYW